MLSYILINIEIKRIESSFCIDMLYQGSVNEWSLPLRPKTIINTKRVAAVKTLSKPDIS